MKKHFVLFLVFLLLISGTHALAESNTIENSDFESKSNFWSQGVLSEESPHAGKYCFTFSSPSETTEFTTLYSMSYLPRLSLEGNTVYTLRFYIRTNMSESINFSPECHVIIPQEENKLIFHVSKISESWQMVSAHFMIDKTGVYDLSVVAESQSINPAFFIDDIKFSLMDFIPHRKCIQGAGAVTIPTSGESTYSYTPAVVDIEGNSVSIRNGNITAHEPLPEGVFFDEKRDVLHVSANAKDNTSVVLFYTPEPSSSTSISLNVLVSKNILTNGGFNDIPLYNGWNNEEKDFTLHKDSHENFYAQIPTFNIQEDFFTGTLIPSHSFVLSASHMYVFRAKIRSEAPFESRQIQTQAQLLEENNTVHIQVSNIGGSLWSEVVAAFYVPFDGIYSVLLGFTAQDARPIYIDDVRIKPETLQPSCIYFDTPMHIAIPEDEQVDVPLFAAVYDQEGSLLKEPHVDFSVTPENDGVTITDNKIKIIASATPQIYTITASLQDNPSVQNYRILSVTNASIGDGSFETTAPGQWWATASPSLLHYVSTYNNVYPSDGNSLARLTMNGAVSALMSDSIYSYKNTQSYVFEADMKITVPDIETVVTVLVDNAFSDSFDDNLVVGQFTLSNSMQHIQKLFTPSEPIVGRLMIAFNTPETHNQQIILMDNVSVSRATVHASGVNISGMPYLDKNLVGKYHFSSNFGATDSSSFRWLLSNTADGIFMPIEGQNEITLSITSNMIDKYVKFEVTPISLSGPVVGAIESSPSIRIGEPIPIDTFVTPLQPDENVFIEDIPSYESSDLSFGGMEVLNIQNFPVSDKHKFLDLTHHWAKNEIELLTAAGIIQGRGNGLFEPQAHVTRAEFSAILARAFKLAPIYYEGQFSDVKYYNWYSGAVAVVTKHGIAIGTSPTTFAPDLPISREEMAVMVMRAYRKTNAPTKEMLQNFSDQKKISDWALQDVGEANALGLIRGLPDGSFQPQRNTTRAEAVVTIKRMLEIFAKSK